MKVGLYGASGYTGFEMARLLARHPHVELHFATSRSQAGERLTSLFPTGPDIVLCAPEEAPLMEVELVFLCLPHAAAAPTAARALESGRRVIDLSADFRLRDPQSYAHWYGQSHPAPDLLSEAVYGLTEFVRPALRAARLVANPGCYPTSALLALQPLVAAGANAGRVIVDAKSGVSGAGRKPKLSSHFVEVAGNLSPYNIGRAHRHLPEMEQALQTWSSDPPELIFSPHLLPVPRGILSTIYAPLHKNWISRDLRRLYEDAYQHEPFVHLLPPGQHATLAHANYTNRCALGLHPVDQTLIITSAIDNLIKGAAGQALQNMNVMLGLDETAGLL